MPQEEPRQQVDDLGARGCWLSPPSLSCLPQHKDLMPPWGKRQPRTPFQKPRETVQAVSLKGGSGLALSFCPAARSWQSGEPGPQCGYRPRRQPCLLSGEGEASLHLVRPPMSGSVTAAATFSNCGLVSARPTQLAGARALEPTGLGAPEEAGLHLSTR